MIEARKGLWPCLANMIIDSEPPRPFRDVCEPWQGSIISAISPIIESVEGLQSSYRGPRQVWMELPKGHDKTGLVGRLAMHAITFGKRHLRVATAASSRDQSRLILQSITDELRMNPWIARNVEVTQNTLRGPSGTLEVLSSEAGTKSGRKDDLVILDELTFWETRDLWDVLVSGMAKRRNSALICITNAGIRNTWQWDIREGAIANPKSWLFIRSGRGRTLASWLDESRIDEIRRSLRPGFSRRVLDNEWIDSTETPLLSREDIEACQRLKRGKDKVVATYIGVDFGRTRDRTVITTIGILATGAIKTLSTDVLKNVAFADQESFLIEAIRRSKARLVMLDKGTQGWTTTENLEAKFPGICRGVHLSDTLMARLGLQVEELIRTRKTSLPDDPELVQDFLQISEVQTSQGKPVLRTSSTGVGHGDRFWSFALAVEASRTLPGSTAIISGAT